jgi:hypothetical protein
MNFIAPVGYAFVADAASKSLTYTAPPGTVITKVDVIDPTDTLHTFPIASGKDPNIQITYDKKKGGGNDSETVTVAAPMGNDLSIKADTVDMSTSHQNSAGFGHTPKHKSHVAGTGRNQLARILRA